MKDSPQNFQTLQVNFYYLKNSLISFFVYFVVYNNTTSRVGWWAIMNSEVCGRKRSWLNLIYYQLTCLGKTDKYHNINLNTRFERGTPEYNYPLKLLARHGARGLEACLQICLFFSLCLYLSREEKDYNITNIC